MTSHLAYGTTRTWAILSPMRRYSLLLALCLLWLSAACQPAPPPRLVITPFPTITPGIDVAGVLPPPGLRPDTAGSLSNPATAIAQANQPTPTPDRRDCPALAQPDWSEDVPADLDALSILVVAFLNAGGDPEEIRTGLVAWEALGETGEVRTATDLTGEGQPEIVLSVGLAGNNGALFILGCVEGRYTELYRLLADNAEPPTIIWLGDVNNQPPNEAVVARRACTSAGACEYETQILQWNASRGRFVNLLDEIVLTLEVPALEDIDDDDVAELVIRLRSRGNTATGPLRTGLNIYDWNGQVYTLSIIQLDSPQYVIQYIHQGDRAFSQLNFVEAAQLYRLALDTEGLRYWFNDGPTTETSYALYRLILAYAVESDPRLPEIILRLNTAFEVTDEAPLANQPPYVEMAYVFLNTLGETQDLHLACTATLAVVDARGEALALLNRYGSRSPRYSRLDLCPY